MSRRVTTQGANTMLNLWRPPSGAGAPRGCFATTYMFDPELFDEQCLARFLCIDSDPKREDLAFLIERETRLSGVYAGVLADHTQAGVAHSLRWDVLAARVRNGKQHAKVTVLAWDDCIRLIVSSANLTEAGYRSNFEVALAVDFTPAESDRDLLASVLAFLRSLLTFVPGQESDNPQVGRALRFLKVVAGMAADWNALPRSRAIRQQLVCTLPTAAGVVARSALEESITLCRTRGTLPFRISVASPFFDNDSEQYRAAEALCKQMARGIQRALLFAVPGAVGSARNSVLRIDAPASLFRTPINEYDADVTVALLPSMDADEGRTWHAKMFAFEAAEYFALMVGSSNFTCAGLGLITRRNVEANLVTIIDSKSYDRQSGFLQSVWPEMKVIDAPERAEWQGATSSEDDEVAAHPLPYGFLSAVYYAGIVPELVICLDASELPVVWAISGVGHSGGSAILDHHAWKLSGSVARVVTSMAAAELPGRLQVTWTDKDANQQQAFLVINVQDSAALLAPAALTEMTAEEMLEIIAASDPGAALRVWARRSSQSMTIEDDHDLDSATPTDLDPLHRYQLASTFLHRVRRKARVMERLRLFIERPVSSLEGLDWRLRGLIGIHPLALKYVAEFEGACRSSSSGSAPAEALLTLADLLIVLREAKYRGQEGAITPAQFKRHFQKFLGPLAGELADRVRPSASCVPTSVLNFWNQVVTRCSE